MSKQKIHPLPILGSPAGHFGLRFCPLFCRLTRMLYCKQKSVQNLVLTHSQPSVFVPHTFQSATLVPLAGGSRCLSAVCYASLHSQQPAVIEGCFLVFLQVKENTLYPLVSLLELKMQVITTVCYARIFYWGLSSKAPKPPLETPFSCFALFRFAAQGKTKKRVYLVFT